MNYCTRVNTMLSNILLCVNNIKFNFTVANLKYYVIVFYNVQFTLSIAIYKNNNKNYFYVIY